MKQKEPEIIQGCEEIELKGNDVGCLVIHGFRSCPYEMKEFGQFLNESGFTVKLCLLPGHGTEPKNLIDKKWQDWVKSNEESLLEIKKKCKKIFIAGLSTGGSLALYLASKHKIDGAIALSPGLYLRKKYAKLSHILKFFWKYKKIKSGPDISINAESRYYSKVPVRAVSELLSFFRALKSKLKLIEVPTLIIYAINDHVVNPKSALKIYKNIASKKKRIIKLEKSFHILTLDIEKEKVFSESAGFIKEVLNQ